MRKEIVLKRIATPHICRIEIFFDIFQFGVYVFLRVRVYACVRRVMYVIDQTEYVSTKDSSKATHNTPNT